MTQEVLKLALEALEADELDMVDDGSGNMVFRKEQAIAAIKEALAQEKALQTLHDENERLGLYKDAYAQPEQCQCPNCRVTLHASDCAVHNEPAYPKGACNCGAQPEQEFVAKKKHEPKIDLGKYAGTYGGYTTPEPSEGYLQKAYRLANELRSHLSIAPPQRTWVGLTDEDTFEIGERLGLSDIAWVDLMQAIEAKLKQKNNG